MTSIQLFNGIDLDNWRPREDHHYLSSREASHAWTVVGEVSLDQQNPKALVTQAGEGIFYNGPEGRTPDLYTEYQHGDCRLQIEFLVPQGSNSGVYMMGKYEIQVFDSWGQEELTFGTCGGIYSRWIDGKSVGGSPPRLNMSRPPGKWQSYEIIFQAPRFDVRGLKVSNARFLQVIWNGETVHQNVEVEGPTRAARLGQEETTGPLMLQGDHGPVAYRNVLIEPN